MDANVWLLILVAVLLVFYFVVVGWALVQVVREKTISRLSKVLWSITIIVAPPFGSMAWYLFGHRTRDVERAVGMDTRT